MTFYFIQEKQQWLCSDQAHSEVDCDVQHDVELDSPPGSPSFIDIATSDQPLNSPPAFTLPMVSDSPSEETGSYTKRFFITLL